MSESEGGAVKPNRHLRLVRNLIISTLGFGCVMAGIPWLSSLGLPLILIPNWANTKKANRPYWMAGAVLLLVAGVILFVQAYLHGTLLARRPEPQWKLILCTVAWCWMVLHEVHEWWERKKGDGD